MEIMFRAAKMLVISRVCFLLNFVQTKQMSLISDIKTGWFLEEFSGLHITRDKLKRQLIAKNKVIIGNLVFNYEPDYKPCVDLYTVILYKRFTGYSVILSYSAKNFDDMINKAIMREIKTRDDIEDMEHLKGTIIYNVFKSFLYYKKHYEKMFKSRFEELMLDSMDNVFWLKWNDNWLYIMKGTHAEYPLIPLKHDLDSYYSYQIINKIIAYIDKIPEFLTENY